MSGHPLENELLAKPIKILIDGYNLLFQSNLVGKGRGPNWLLRARQRLVKSLQERLSKEDLSGTHIIFDASAKREPEDARVAAPHVRFAVEHPEADDLLEELIRTHAHPKTLLVVSSDHRIQRCARARKCQVMAADAYLDFLHSGAAKQQELEPEGAQPPKAELSAEDVDYWLDEFNLDDKSEPK